MFMQPLKQQIFIRLRLCARVSTVFMGNNIEALCLALRYKELIRMVLLLRRRRRRRKLKLKQKKKT